MASRYLCAFLQPDDHSPPRLGNAVRFGMQTSKMELDAAKFLYYLLFYSPNPWKLEQEYLIELQKLSDSASQIVNELSALDSPDVADWVHRLSACLPPLPCGETSVVPSLTNLATQYFNHVGLALLNLSGKHTPNISVDPVPDTDRVHAIKILLREAAEKQQKPHLKLLVQLRDAPMCPITGWPFSVPDHKKWGMVSRIATHSQLVHIMPFSLHSKTQAHVALEAFTGYTITAEDIVKFINAPKNAVLLEAHSHRDYDVRFAWGIEAVPGSDGIVRYYSRLVRPGYLSFPAQNQMDKELFFGTNVTNQDHPIDLPDPRFCNTMLAIMRVLHASGAADVLQRLREDEEDSRNSDSGMGVSDALDNLLYVKLHLASMSSEPVVTGQG